MPASGSSGTALVSALYVVAQPTYPDQIPILPFCENKYYSRLTFLHQRLFFHFLVENDIQKTQVQASAVDIFRCFIFFMLTPHVPFIFQLILETLGLDMVKPSTFSIG